MHYNEDPDELLHKGLMAASGEDQLDAEDKEAEDILNGDYDDAEFDDLEEVMNAEEDEEDEEFALDADYLLAKDIVSECEGVDDIGQPKATTAYHLELVEEGGRHLKTIARGAAFKPIISIEPRTDMIEVRMTFPRQNDPDLRAYYHALELYGSTLKKLSGDIESFVELAIVIVPIGTMGTYFMDAHNPVSWYIQPDEGGEMCILHILFHDEDIYFRESDEDYMLDEISAAEREIDAEAKEKYGG